MLILGTGTIGLLAALFAQTRGVEVHLVGQDESSLALAATMGFAGTWTHDSRPTLPWDAVIDATNHASMPALAVDLVEPSGRVVFIGLSGTPSDVDTRTVALKDVTTVGILGGSAGLGGTISAYAAGDVDPRPLVAATVALDQTGAVLAGQRPGASSLAAPKFHIDPRT